MIPGRCQNVDEARRRHGPLADRFFSAMNRADETAGAVVGSCQVDPIAALRTQLGPPPSWVNWNRIRRGGETLARTGPLGPAVLTFYSLLVGYRSPGGTKPLTFSGRLVADAPKRLPYTGDFIRAVTAPGGLQPGGEGEAYALRVRLTHARVRAAIAATGGWDAQMWGVPINQGDMMGTYLLFSWVTLQGLRRLGFRFTIAEAEDYLHLWRYVGHLIGVEAPLLAHNEAAARERFSLIECTELEPDDDGRALTAALLGAAACQATTPGERRRARVAQSIYEGLARGLLGDHDADRLAIPRGPWRHIVPALRTAIRSLDPAARHLPIVRRLAIAYGLGYWDRATRRDDQGIAAALRPGWRALGWARAA